MHLLTITTSFPTSEREYGGIFILRTLNAMVGVQQTVLLPGDEQETWENLLKDGELIKAKYAPDKLSVLTSSRVEGGIPEIIKKHPWSILLYPLMLISLFYNSLRRCNQKTVIHAHWLPNGLVGVLIKKVKNIPIVVTIRGADQSLLHLPLIGSICRWILKNSDAITTVSETLMKDVSEIPGLCKKTFFIANGVNISDNKRIDQNHHFSIIYVGSLIIRKSVDTLLQAVSQLKDYNIHLSIVGDGPERGNLYLLAQKLQLENISFLGRQNPDKIQDLIGMSSCLVLPSLSEGTPNVVKEAMGCAVPVIATDVGGIPELLIHNRTGLLFKPQDVEKLIKNIKILHNNVEFASMLGENGRKYLIDNEMTWEKTALNLKKIYTSISMEK